MTDTVLQIDASARTQGSTSRKLTARIAEKLGGSVIKRDLASGLPQINEAWVGANFTPADDRSDAQKQTLALSDSLIDELKQADVIVIGVPMYNFGVPAALKAWVDLVARAGVTFRYTENGPEGLLTGKRAVLAVTSGGTQVGSDIDFATGYMKHFLGFIGIHDVEVVAADRQMVDNDAATTRADDAIDALAA